MDKNFVGCVKNQGVLLTKKTSIYKYIPEVMCYSNGS